MMTMKNIAAIPMMWLCVALEYMGGRMMIWGMRVGFVASDLNPRFPRPTNPFAKPIPPRDGLAHQLKR